MPMYCTLTVFQIKIAWTRERRESANKMTGNYALYWPLISLMKMVVTLLQYNFSLSSLQKTPRRGKMTLELEREAKKEKPFEKLKKKKNKKKIATHKIRRERC